MRTLLIDTGPLVAYLDPTDAAHHAVAGSLDDFAGMLCSTSAVITEAMYLLKSNQSGPRRLAEFVQAASIHVFESAQAQQLFSAVSLMEKYSNVPMDFADATLVLLSDELGSNDIATLDRRGFLTYRTRKGKSFRIFPAKS